ncbi:hypothetical protein RZS08_52855, partial [Arthrospira platensis SPKY1]|nr:hypothetical protein [Arthrospira platensis SPKY1]
WERAETDNDILLAWKHHLAGHIQLSSRMFSRMVQQLELPASTRAMALNGFAEEAAVRNQWENLLRLARESANLEPNQHAAYLFGWQASTVLGNHHQAMQWLERFGRVPSSVLAIDV